MSVEFIGMIATQEGLANNTDPVLTDTVFTDTVATGTVSTDTVRTGTVRTDMVRTDTVVAWLAAKAKAAAAEA